MHLRKTVGVQLTDADVKQAIVEYCAKYGVVIDPKTIWLVQGVGATASVIPPTPSIFG